ncbi:hypothetical protein [Microbacterium timonense]|jgi:hypothetical protein|uniref:hypothetical protein n=1 Tax=Microbacterium timonense TaxID=2086576 RepID=UPI000D0EC012|nr:hypothetical protein [Microbacterium timonense]
MTDIDPRLEHDRVLRHDSDLEEVLELLLTEAMNPRQLWLFYLDDGDRLTGPIMPCDDYPDHPDDLMETGDLGVVSFADVLAQRILQILEAVEASQVVLVWERPGPREFAPDELRWARAMARSCADAGVRLRAQFLLHDGGVRQLAPDDHLGV